MCLLKDLFTPADCAKCQFCCSFRRCSLWETPVFTAKEIEKFKTKYPDVKFKKINAFNSEGYMIDVLDRYKTDDSEEEVFCAFNKGKGCIMDKEDKSFECSAWPFRVMNKDGELVIGYCVDCRAIKEKTPDEMKNFLESSGLAQKMADYAKNFPACIRDYKENYKIIKILGKG